MRASHASAMRATYRKGEGAGARREAAGHPWSRTTGPSSMSSDPVLIIGAGAFGTSTAYHLVSRGYTDVTVVDRFSVPSFEAASTDLNKVIRSDYSEPIYSRLGMEAIDEWARPDGIFAPFYHRTGWLLAAESMSLGFVAKSLENSRALGVKGAEYVTPEQIRERFPSLHEGTFPAWSTLWNPTAGWADAALATQAMAQAAAAKGAKFLCAEEYHVKQLAFNESGSCTGVILASGKYMPASLVVLAAGAGSNALVETNNTLNAKAHCVGHVQLTEEEAKYYADIPVIDHLEKGIIFPPNRDNIMKVTTVRFLSNYRGGSVSHKISATDAPQVGIPARMEREIRDFVAEVIPQVAERPWIMPRICWDLDSPDLHFCIGPHTAKGLHIATAGSAHGFKFLPIIGKYIADSLEDKLPANLKDAWKWRPLAPPPADKEHHAHPFPERELLDPYMNKLS